MAIRLVIFVWRKDPRTGGRMAFLVGRVPRRGKRVSSAVLRADQRCQLMSNDHRPRSPAEGENATARKGPRKRPPPSMSTPANT
jgi:hypothetical protein